jgi:hypothetical protein
MAEDYEEYEGSEEVTWVLFKAPGFDDLYEQAGDSLDANLEKLKIYPVNIDKKRTLFLARFEIPAYKQDFQYSDAILDKSGEPPLAWFDFLAGFPIKVIETLVMVGEISSRLDLKDGKLEAMDGGGDVTPPFPESLFEGYADNKILVNTIAFNSEFAEWMAKNLEGEPESTGLTWWVRANLPNVEGSKFPYPGEFFGLACRLMVGRYWDQQESSPFIFSGNWIDTVYLTGAVIKEITEPTDDVPYPVYKIQWRKFTVDGVHASDFSEFKVGDRVCILKDVTTEKKTQTWKDDDMKTFGTEGGDSQWVIVPFSFYGIDPEEEE